MAYVNIPNSVFEAGKPARALDMRNLRDNLPAMAAGDAGAPRVLGKALGGIYLGRVSSATGNPWLGFTGLDGHGRIAFFFTLNGALQMRIRFTGDNGTTWGSGQAFTVGPIYFGLLTVNLQTGSYAAQGSSAGDTSKNEEGTFTVPSGCNGFQVSPVSSTSYSGFALSIGGIE